MGEHETRRGEKLAVIRKVKDERMFVWINRLNVYPQ